MMTTSVHAPRDLSLRRTPRVRWVAYLAVVVAFAIVAPMSAVGAPGMKQAKRYQGPSSASAFARGPGFGGLRLRDPVSFRVPQGARSVRVSIRDDSGLDVRAFVGGDVTHNPNRLPACDVPQTVALARSARVLLVSPDVGHYGRNWDIIVAGDGGSCFLPLSVPTTGTITVVFSKHRCTERPSRGPYPWSGLVDC